MNFPYSINIFSRRPFKWMESLTTIIYRNESEKRNTLQEDLHRVDGNRLKGV